MDMSEQDVWGEGREGIEMSEGKYDAEILRTKCLAVVTHSREKDC